MKEEQHCLLFYNILEELCFCANQCWPEWFGFLHLKKSFFICLRLWYRPVTFALRNCARVWRSWSVWFLGGLQFFFSPVAVKVLWFCTLSLHSSAASAGRGSVWSYFYLLLQGTHLQAKDTCPPAVRENSTISLPNRLLLFSESFPVDLQRVGHAHPVPCPSWILIFHPYLCAASWVRSSDPFFRSQSSAN